MTTPSTEVDETNGGPAGGIGSKNRKETGDGEERRSASDRPRMMVAPDLPVTEADLTLVMTAFIRDDRARELQVESLRESDFVRPRSGGGDDLAE